MFARFERVQDANLKRARTGFLMNQFDCPLRLLSKSQSHGMCSQYARTL